MINKELEKLLRQCEILDGTLKPLPPMSKELFTALEEWRTSIINLIFCFEKFGMEKYYKDAQRQSLKFAARMADVFEGLNEHGDGYDIERSLVSIRTEQKMLDFDRNKIFNICNELCRNIVEAGESLGSGSGSTSKPVQRRIEINPSESKPSRENKTKHRMDDGSEYTGEWLNGEPDGQGKRTWPPKEADSGEKSSKYKLSYEGSFRYGRAHGFGKCKFANGDIYEGHWENDEKYGQGKQTNKKGIILTGNWSNGTVEGLGTEEWPNGDVYHGDFAMSKKHGNGTFKFNDGSEYTGEFKENSINGYGTYIWNDGRKYEGYFKNNKMEGVGKYTWPQGESYEGEYKNDKRHGKGKFCWPDGRIYDGYFEDGKKHGEAVYTDKRGEKKTGEWNKGKHVKWHN